MTSELVVPGVQGQGPRTLSTAGWAGGGVSPGQRSDGEALANTDADADAGQDRVEVAVAGPARSRSGAVPLPWTANMRFTGP